MRRNLLLWVIMLLCGALTVAQQPASQPAAAQQPGAPQPSVTFRAETNFVEVHAIVTDEKGNFVRGLTRDDFEIYENGRLQQPAVFSLVDLPIDRPVTLPSGGPGGGEPIEPDVRATARTFDGRIYVLLLDDLHTVVTRGKLVQDIARQFIQRYLGVNDLAAVVYSSGRQDAGQELTGNRRLLLAAIDRFIGRKLPSAGVERLAVHLRQANQDEANSQAEIRTQERAQQARDVRDPLDDQRAFYARQSLEAIENVATWLGDVQGRRKALLYFSEGIDYDIYQPFGQGNASAIVASAQRVTGAAQRANVNIYGIDPRGLSQFGGLIDINARSDYPQLDYGNFKGELNELRLSQESLISLSDETGGLAVVNSNDVAGGLGRIVLDNSRYYLLGYYSDAKTWSGKFLKLEVRAKRPGLQVRARTGFLPPDPKKIAKAREAEVKAGTSPALKAALSKPVPVGELPFRVFAAPFKGAGPKASVLLALEIDGAGLKFQEGGGRFNETLEVSIVAADQRAKVQGGDRQTFELKLMPETRDRVSRTGVRMLSRLDLPPGRYQFHVGAHESSGSAIGTVPYDLEVPDFSKLTFGMSGVLVTSATDPLVTANPDLQLKDIFPGAPVVRRVFTRAETLSVFTEIYNNTGQVTGAINIVASVRNALDGRNVFNLDDRRTIDASGRARTHGFTADVPLKDLAPGTYVLTIEAGVSAVGQSAHRDVLFEVREGAR